MTCKIGKDAMNDVGLKQDHGVVVDSNGVITFVGSTDEVKSYVAEKGGAKREIDCDGRAVVPGLVDSHTHAVHSGDRSLELAAKLSGESYTSITSRGGGIHFTVAETRKASLPELENALRARLRAMIMEGTTTVEIKSGYGLDTETEIKMLRAIHNVSRDMPIKIVTTFLGAHAVRNVNKSSSSSSHPLSCHITTKTTFPKTHRYLEIWILTRHVILCVTRCYLVSRRHNAVVLHPCL